MYPDVQVSIQCMYKYEGCIKCHQQSGSLAPPTSDGYLHHAHLVEGGVSLAADDQSVAVSRGVWGATLVHKHAVNGVAVRSQQSGSVGIMLYTGGGTQ